MTMRLMMSVRRLALVACLTLLPRFVAAQTAEDFFNPDVLHRVDLLVNSRDWEKLKANFQVNDYYPADVRWQGVTVRNVGIRSRGFGSRSGTKPGLRVDANRFASGQDFLGLKSFIVDNLTQDPSGIRERVAMRLFERMGLPAPREAHAVLYVNDQYAGLYAIVESIDKDALRRFFGVHDDGNVENDGYLYEYNWVSPYFFNDLGGLDAYVPLFSPKTHETGSMTDLYGSIAEMVRTINQSPDAMFVSTVSSYLDLPLFMKHVAVQAYLAEWDGILGYAGMNNFYLYRFEHTTRSQFIAWDEDNAFHALDYGILQGHEENVLMRRAMQVPELRAAYFDALLAAVQSASELPGLGEPPGPGWLEREITKERLQISDAMRTDPVKPFTNADFEASMDGLLEFARQRGDFVRCEVTKIIDPVHAGAVCPPGQ